MADTTNPISEVTEDACWGYLASQEVGRLVTAIDGLPEVFPVNFVLDGESVVFRTAEGTKLHNLVVNEHIAFEIDGWDEEIGWSVVLHGRAEIVDDPEDLARFAKMPLRPWVPTMKVNWVRLSADRMTGRRFEFGPEPTA